MQAKEQTYTLSDGLPEYMNGQWLEHSETRMLYIVPTGTDEIEGPDDGVLDALNAECIEHGYVRPICIERLELIEVPHNLRRYSLEDGYYHA